MRVMIDYSDGQYTMQECGPEWKNSIEIDDRDWERYKAFRRVAWGWDAFIRDLDQPGEAIGPQPVRSLVETIKELRRS